jgi:hypothetical protein
MARVKEPSKTIRSNNRGTREPSITPRSNDNLSGQKGKVRPGGANTVRSYAGLKVR